jgi:hypothetical protein
MSFGWGGLNIADDDEDVPVNYEDHPMISTFEAPCELPAPSIYGHQECEVIITETWWAGIMPMLKSTRLVRAVETVVQNYNTIHFMRGFLNESYFVATFQSPCTIRLRAPNKHVLHTPNTHVTETIRLLTADGALEHMDTEKLEDHYDADEDIDALKQMEIGLPFQQRWKSLGGTWLCIYKEMLHITEDENPTHLYPKGDLGVIREYLPSGVVQGIKTMGQLMLTEGERTMVVTEPDRVALWTANSPEGTFVSCFLNNNTTPPVRMEEYARVIGDTPFSLPPNVAQPPLMWKMSYEGFAETSGVIVRSNDKTLGAPYSLTIANATTPCNPEYAMAIKAMRADIKEDPYRLIDLFPKISTALSGGPDFLLKSNIPGTHDATSCAVCLWEEGDEPMDVDEVPIATEVMIPGCKHTFHESCLRVVMARSTNRCPVCRGSTDDVQFKSVSLTSWDHKAAHAFQTAISHLMFGSANIAVIIGPPGAIDRVAEEHGMGIASQDGSHRIVMIKSEDIDAPDHTVVVLCGLNIYNPLHREKVRQCVKLSIGKDIAVDQTSIVHVTTSGTYDDDGETDWYRGIYRQLI